MKIRDAIDAWVQVLRTRELTPNEESDAEMARAAARERATEAARLRDAGVPSKVAGVSTASWFRETTPAWVALAHNGGKDVIAVLSGGVGAGKSVAAARWLSAGDQIVWVGAAELARWPRYDRDSMDMLLGADRLVVDDLGTEFLDASGNFRAVLDEVVCRRVDDGRKTVITTNLSVDDFVRRYDERIADRINGSGAFHGVGDVSLRGGA